MFSSFSPLQNGYDKQNERLQSLHVFFEARSFRSDDGAWEFTGKSRGTMLLLPKHVHLQKDVRADSQDVSLRSAW